MSFDYTSVFVFLAKDVGVWLFFVSGAKQIFFPPFHHSGCPRLYNAFIFIAAFLECFSLESDFCGETGEVCSDRGWRLLITLAGT